MTEDALPSPLTPPDCELKNFSWMPIEGHRLKASGLRSEESPEACWAAIQLWISAWYQVPAGSLEDNELWIADQAGYVMHGKISPKWKKIRAGALRNFKKCNDGRLYHPVVCEKALEAWIEKLMARFKSGLGNLKRWGMPFDDELDIIQSISDSKKMLLALNPSSTTLKKKVPKPSSEHPTGIPQGIQEGFPFGSQQTGQDKTGQDLSNTTTATGAVITGEWWPSAATLKDLDFIYHYDEEFINKQLVTFKEYWIKRNEPRASWDSLFVQHCENRAKLTVV